MLLQLSVTGALLALPDRTLSTVSAADLAMVRALRASVPAIPVGRNDSSGLGTSGGYYLTPAEYWSRNGNDENTELYSVHPFQLMCINRTSLDSNYTGGLTALGVDEGRATYFRRLYPKNLGETADIMQAARLGLANEAAWMVPNRAA